MTQPSPVDARVPFYRVQLLGVRCAAAVEPELVVVADRVHDERVVLPSANRMSPPCRNGIDGMPAAVHVDDTMRTSVARLVQHVDVRQPLRGIGHREFPRVRIDARNAHRQARRIGFLCLVSPGPEVPRPGQQRQLSGLQSTFELDVHVGATADPGPGEVNCAVRQPRNRLAVGIGVRNRRCGQEDVVDFTGCRPRGRAPYLLRLRRGRKRECNRDERETPTLLHEDLHVSGVGLGLWWRSAR